MAILFLALFILILSWSRRLFQAWLNPISLFVCLFFFAFFVLFSVNYIDTKLLDAELYLLYFLSFFAYILGVLLAYNKHKGIKNILRTKELDNEKRYAREIRVLFYIVAIFTLLHWSRSIAQYGILGLFSALIVTKFEDMDTSNIFIMFSMISMFLSPYTFFYILKYKKWKTIYSLILLFTFIANLSYSRATLFWIFFLDIFVLVYYYQFNRIKKSPIKIIILVALALFLFGSYFSSTQEMLGKASDDTSSTFWGIPISASVATIITYFAGPLVSPYHYLRMNVDVPDFGFTLRLLYDRLSIIGINIDTEKYMPEEFVPIPFQFNTTAIHYYIFSEGGFIWVVLFFCILGFIVDKAYYSFQKRGDRFSLMWLCFLSLLLFMSLRSYLMTFLCALIYLIALFILKQINRIKL